MTEERSADELDDLDLAELVLLAENAAIGDPSGDGEERWEYVRALHRRSEDGAFEAATRFCTHRDPLIRRLGADILGQLGWAVEKPYADRSEPVLVSLLTDEDPNVIACAIVALGHTDRGDPRVIQPLIEHADEEVRHAVAFALGGREDPVSIESMIRLSTDRDLDVRSWATFGLASLIDDVDTPELRAALVSRLEDEDEEVRGEAMGGLALRGDDTAIPTVHAGLAADDVSSLVIGAAATYGRPEFLPPLRALLELFPDDIMLLDAIARCGGPEGRIAEDSDYEDSEDEDSEDEGDLED